MAIRMVSGKLAGGDYGLRVSRPGYDAFAEGYGSRNISFDSRIVEPGTVIAAGLVQCGGAAISFPALPYIPIASISYYDPMLNSTWIFQNATGGVASGHLWIPAVAIVGNSSIRVDPLIGPTYDQRSFYNPTGQWFQFNIFADGG